MDTLKNILLVILSLYILFLTSIAKDLNNEINSMRDTFENELTQEKDYLQMDKDRISLSELECYSVNGESVENYMHPMLSDATMIIDISEINNDYVRLTCFLK